METPINYVLLFLESSGFVLVDVGLGFLNKQIQKWNELLEQDMEV